MKYFKHFLIILWALFSQFSAIAQRVISPDTVVYCQQGTQTFAVDTDPMDVNYEWQVDSIGTQDWMVVQSGNSPTYNATNIAPSGIRYRVIIKKTMGDMETSSIALMSVVDPVNEILFSGDTSICGGGETTIKLENAWPFIVTWSGPNNFTSYDSTVTLSTTGTYTVSYSTNGGSGCNISREIEIVGGSGPTVQIDINPQSQGNNYCAGKQVILSTSGDLVTKWEWKGPSQTGSTDDDWTVTLNGSGSQTYMVTVTGDNNCTSSASVTLNVNAAPAVNILPTTLEVCTSATNIQLSTTGGPFSKYSWVGPGGFSSSDPMPQLINPQTGTYTVTVTDANSCTNSAIRTAVLPPGLNVTMNTNHNSICPDDILEIKPGNAPLNGYTYKWSNNATTWSIPALTPGTYTVTITHVATGCTESYEKTVSAGVVNAQIHAPAVSCVSSALVISGSSQDPTSDWQWNWTGPGTINNPMAQSITVQNLPIGSHTYTVTVTNSRGCTTEISATLEVIDKPEVEISGPTVICKNAAPMNYVVNQQFNTYKWQVQGGNIVGATPFDTDGSVKIDWKENTSIHKLTVTVTIGSCANTNTLNVTLSNEEALPPGTVFKKPSHDILIFELDKNVYTKPLTYKWGALKVINKPNGIIVPYPLETEIMGVAVSDTNQYFYVGQTLDSLVNAGIVFYVIISDGSGCPVYCYYPSDPVNKGGGGEFEEENQEEAENITPKIIPNPNSGSFRVQLPEVYNGTVNYWLCHAAGVLARNGTASVSSGYCPFDFSGGQFPPGMYYLTIQKPGFGIQTSLKMIIR